VLGYTHRKCCAAPRRRPQTRRPLDRKREVLNPSP
jgi:hypothetical protein